MRQRLKTGLAVAGVLLGTTGVSSSCATSTQTSSTTAPGVTVAPTTVEATTTTAAPAVVLTLSGTGIKQTANFTLTHDQWTIAYNYNCANWGPKGVFGVVVRSPTGSYIPGL